MQQAYGINKRTMATTRLGVHTPKKFAVGFLPSMESLRNSIFNAITPTPSTPAPAPVQQATAQVPPGGTYIPEAAVMQQAANPQGLADRMNASTNAAGSYADGTPYVEGKGSGTSDSVHGVSLSKGEAVLPAKTVQALGVENINDLIQKTNDGKVPKFGIQRGGHYAVGDAGAPDPVNAAYDNSVPGKVISSLKEGLSDTSGFKNIAHDMFPNGIKPDWMKSPSERLGANAPASAVVAPASAPSATPAPIVSRETPPPAAASPAGGGGQATVEQTPQPVVGAGGVTRVGNTYSTPTPFTGQVSEADRQAGDARNQQLIAMANKLPDPNAGFGAGNNPIVSVGSPGSGNSWSSNGANTIAGLLARRQAFQDAAQARAEGKLGIERQQTQAEIENKQGTLANAQANTASETALREAQGTELAQKAAEAAETAKLQKTASEGATPEERNKAVAALSRRGLGIGRYKQDPNTGAWVDTVTGQEREANKPTAKLEVGAEIDQPDGTYVAHGKTVTVKDKKLVSVS